MTTSDWILVLNGIASGIAILLAPVFALWIGGILQRRSDAYKAKLAVFSRLVSLRHANTSNELIELLNSIDAVFADDRNVREAWTRYRTALNDPSLRNAPGSFILVEKRHELLLEMVKALGLSRNISSADIRQGHWPAVVQEEDHVRSMERTLKRMDLEGELTKRDIPVPPCNVPGPIKQTPPPQQTASPTGNGADQPR
jgi:hypothetical protein